MDALNRALRAEFWKSNLLSPTTTRTGDKAAVVRNHGCGPAAQETGLLVRVVNAPVFGTIYCEHCAGRVDEWVVEVVLIDHLGRDLHEGVYAYPVKWLQRVLPLGHVDASGKQIFAA